MKNSDTTMSTTPNYRIYDRTGGGVTEDIYAESLESAIAQGRAWIEAGDWDSHKDGVYRTITLSACVREIVRYPLVAAEGQHIDEDGDLIVTATGNVIAWADELGEIDDDATDDGESWDCSGEYIDELPQCDAEAEEGGEAGIATDSDGHDWRKPYSLVGGLRENPGYWSKGGTVTASLSVCACCGRYRHELDKGSQCHEDEAQVVIEINDRDEASEAWLKRIHADADGWLPEWLASYLDCAPACGAAPPWPSSLG